MFSFLTLQTHLFFVATVSEKIIFYEHVFFFAALAILQFCKKLVLNNIMNAHLL